MMKITTIKVGDLATNCYLLEKNGKVLIIDPGDDFSLIKSKIESKHVVGCLVTHFHFDHIGALEEVLSYYNLEVNKVTAPDFVFETIETPGHTFDSKTFYFKNEKVMFTGDFIFKSSIGRTDLGGNDKDMVYSLNLIEKYADDIAIYPGHGPSTNLGQEKKNFRTYF